MVFIAQEHLDKIEGVVVVRSRAKCLSNLYDRILLNRTRCQRNSVLRGITIKLNLLEVSAAVSIRPSPRS